MVTEGVYGSEGFFYGEYSSLSPDYGNFIGYRMNAAGLGFPGSPQTANQLGETVNALKQGVKAFEVTMLDPNTTDTIPKQHFKEMRQLMKISGVKPSVHGPLIDPAGFGEKGWGGEQAIEDNIRRMNNVIERAQMLDPKGNIPIVFHASNGAPSAEWEPYQGKEGDNSLGHQRTAAVINQETGQVQAMREKRRYSPHTPDKLPIEKEKLKEGGYWFTADDQIRSANETEWDRTMTDLATYNKNADEILGNSASYLYDFNDVVKDAYGKVFHKGTGENLNPESINSQEEIALEKMEKASIFLDNVQLSFTSAFDRAFEFGNDKQRKELKKLADSFSREMENIAEYDLNDKGEPINVIVPILQPLKKKEILDKSIKQLHLITERRMGGAPTVYKPVEDFVGDKAAETFGRVAFDSYKKFKDKAPTLVIENPPVGMALNRAEELNKLIDDARENFKNDLIKNEGLDEKEAKKIAEKQIGATWDVGHINLLKKTGFSDEDIIKETSKIGKKVKHIHLTDNFGYNDSHLAPGMGNVPFKKILEELEKHGKVNEMRKIVESGAFVQQFKKSPHPLALQAFGSGIYGAKAEMYWNQTQGMYGSYFGGYGTVNPQTHHSLYGSGFTTLPIELGGNIPGSNSRFSGNSMA